MKTTHSKVSQKGQLTLPKEFRDNLNIKPGDEVLIMLTDESIVIKPKIMHLGMLRGLLQDELSEKNIEQIHEEILTERKKWSL